MDKLDEAIRYIMAGECLPFIGAGLSIQAGCTGWKYIPEKLMESPIIKNALEENPLLFPSIANNQEIIGICKRILIEKGESEEYKIILRTALRCDPQKLLGEYAVLMRGIKRIYSFSKNIITTNIDDCIEQSDLFPPRIAVPYYNLDEFRILKLNRGAIFHIHGYREAFLNSVFTEEDYRVRYNDSGFENFLCHIINNYSLLFMGYGFQDEDLMNLMAKMKRRIHFGLVRKGAFEPEKKVEFFNRYNIKIIEYENHEKFPSEFDAWTAKNIRGITLGGDITDARQ